MGVLKMKFCVNCGHQLKSDQKFCTNCGAKQPELAQPTTPASSVAPVTPQVTPVAPTQEQATPATPSVAEPVTPTEAATSDVPEQPVTASNVNAPVGQTAGDTGAPVSQTQAPQQSGTSTAETAAPNRGYTYTLNGQFGTQATNRSAQTVAKSTGDSQTIWMVVGAIVLILIGVAGYNGYNTYKRDHQTGQQIANLSGRVARKYLGSDTVTAYYDKSSNEISLEAETDSDLYDTMDDLVNGYDETDDMQPYLSKLKKISTAISPLMPTNSKDVRVEYMNPENTDRYLFIAVNGELTYDFTE